MKGNEALAEAAIRAGMRGYFGYPITPQSEVVEYLAMEQPKHNYVLLQAESEVASINMVYGAAGAGARTMTTTSSPGFSLMQEGMSYIACAELPCVVVNVVRGGPGLGTIQPGQGDYFQAVKGGGHGDYRLIVLAPNSVQEMADHTMLAFDLADQYRNPVLILTDGAIGQMMEKVELPDPVTTLVEKPWASTGKTPDRERNVITSLFIKPEDMEQKNIELQAKYRKIAAGEVRFEEYLLDDAEVVLMSYGVTSRICKKVVDLGREQGVKMGLLRPVTLWPYPTERVAELAAQDRVKMFVTAEMNAGQMVEDVRLAVNGRKPVYSTGRMGGIIPTPGEILDFTLRQMK
ncbi:MAG: 3-methyl-2-oxobutanoate dehydrogenase subunit VorB [Acidobacteriota bacterium]|jgi:2-oxoglutarate ferredoxin oxidoreductase subunit alpha|nr:3-methyl-2-oxobutanoate dehydrogenase subunit VorB [Acidobacteriota bacterium]